MELNSLAAFKSNLEITLHGISKDEAHAQGICIRCKKILVGEFTDPLDEKEYQISGLCPACFNEITLPENGDEQPNEYVDELEIGAMADFETPESLHARLWRAVDAVADGDEKYDFETISSKYVIYKIAHTLGDTLGDTKEIVFPKEDELFIDIDTPAQLDTLLKNIPKFDLHINKIVNINVRASENAGHYHVVLELDAPFGTHQRYLYQALLGSDPTRELLSLVRDKNDDPHPTLFIEKKQLALPPMPDDDIPY